MYRSPLNGPSRISDSFIDHVNAGRPGGTDLLYTDRDNYGSDIVSVCRAKVEARQDDYNNPEQPLRKGERWLYLRSIDNPTITFLYLHNSENLVKVGDIVEEGQLIARMGNFGWVSPKPTPERPHDGTHLHFEVRVNNVRQDPEKYTDFNKHDDMSQAEREELNAWRNFPLNKTLETLHPLFKKDEELQNQYYPLHENVSNNDLPTILRRAKIQIDLEAQIPKINEELKNFETLKTAYANLNDAYTKLQEESKTKFSWNKAWIDLTRNGAFTAVAGIAVTTIVGFIVAKIPELQPYQEQIILALLTFFGISTAGQNLYQTVKVQNAK